jgi:hypothetical protein
LAETFTGTCFCGAIQLELTGAPEEMGYCHCQSCRSYSGERVSTFILYKAENVRVVSGEDCLGRFTKTAMSERQFCRRCGGHLMTYHPQLGLTDVQPEVVRDIAFEPSVHLNYAERIMRMQDGLPKLRDFPTHAGGSGVTLPD